MALRLFLMELAIFFGKIGCMRSYAFTAYTMNPSILPQIHLPIYVYNQLPIWTHH